jgi:hypothetical protein
MAAAPLVGHAQSPASLMQSRYQLTQMERVLGGAAEHGARVAREQMRTMIPADMLLSDNVRVRGFRLEGYGIFFDVEMPPLEGTLPWIFQTLDQNNLGLDSAIREMTKLVESAGNPPEARQALQRISMQVSATPLLSSQSRSGGPGDARAAGSAAALSVDQSAAPSPAMRDPQEAYRSGVRTAIIDAMLDHSAALRLEEGETLTVALRGNEDRPRLNPGDYDSPTIQISMRGADLLAFQARQITREEALSRIAIKVF